MRPRSVLLLLMLAAAGCASEAETAPPASACLPPNRVLADRCLPPAVQDDGCPAGTLSIDDGSCQPAGVPPELCGAGFEADGRMGCEPILPPEPCLPGLMAVPGETACHPVMACGAGKWGDIPIDATTVYVDASYAGMDSDGTADKPWSTIVDAVSGAPHGALVAVAAGSYLEEVVIAGKPLRLWGVCPQQVALVGTSTGISALRIRPGASGTEVHGLTLGGNSIGLVVSGAEDVLVDRVWIYDALWRGVNVEGTLGPTGVTLNSSLVEQNREHGVFVTGAEVTLTGMVVRGTLPRPSDGQLGRGINIQLACIDDVCFPEARSTAHVRGSLVEHNHDIGVFLMGADATLEDLVVRSTAPAANDPEGGRGMVIQRACSPANCDPATRSVVSARSSLIDQNHDVGVMVAGSQATLEGVIVRNTLPRTSDQTTGSGIDIQLSCLAGVCRPEARSSALVRSSLVERNHLFGVTVFGSDATLEGVLVRATQPRASDAQFGRGINIQLACTADSCDPSARSAVGVRGSHVEDNHDLGVSVIASDATLAGLLVRATKPNVAHGIFGDGLAILSHAAPATATVTSGLIDANARAGLSSFGASVELGSTTLSCNNIDLAGEHYLDQPATLEDLGFNLCGCPTPTSNCHAISAGLTPPPPPTDQ